MGDPTRLQAHIASGPRRQAVDGAGISESTFQRAIERGNLLVAKTVLRELGRVSLFEALQLTALIAPEDPRRHPRVSTRRRARHLETHEAATIDKCARRNRGRE